MESHGNQLFKMCLNPQFRARLLGLKELFSFQIFHYDAMFDLQLQSFFFFLCLFVSLS